MKTQVQIYTIFTCIQGRSQKKIEGGPNFVTFKSDVIYFSSNAAYSPHIDENINFVEFLSKSYTDL